MAYFLQLLKHYNVDLQPSNSKLIDIESAKDILYPGAHIATSNSNEYFHHGVVLDPNASDISIIHFWSPEKADSRVQITTLPIFLAGGIDLVGKRTRYLYLINYENDTPEKREETLKIAEDMFEKADEIPYVIATSNCEHFACFCRTGQWKSEQVEKVKNLLIMKTSEIYETIKAADEKHLHYIASLLNSLPKTSLTSEEKILYDQFCQKLE